MTSETDPFFWKLIPIITSILALVVIYANARFGLRNKQADLIIHFHKQFDELQKKRAELLTAHSERAASVEGAWSQQRTEVEAEMFFDRFWSLQFDQFLAWYEGYVPTRLYVYWAFSRWRELHTTTAEWTIANRTMASTLDQLKNRWQNNPDKSSRLSTHVSNFLGLMFALKQTSTSADMNDLLRRYGPSSLRRLARLFFGAD
ncbi:hypothetical protein KVG96_14465 [Pseudomonas sp. COR58]|uniref:DUF4760 domain-containing protein n=1 Tax=Pseudomonas ekonensis TaxID=2842353 RepID=A0ABS6PFE1_9PSED|nr:hypothetical protein [Pseudomonas ekonensis]MBV4459160.1 hypothetical protein [Pseudomonas ekonensis]